MLTLVALRQAVAAAIDAARGSSGWRESPIPFGSFGSREASSRLDKGYAVGVPDTSAHGGRQKLTEGALVESQVVVGWRRQLAALDQVTGYDTALGDEAEIIKAVRDITAFSVQFRGARRTVDTDGWMSGELTFSVMHRLAMN